MLDVSLPPLLLDTAWTLALLAGHLAIASALTVDIVRYKTSDRAAVAWVGLVWLSPFVGWFLYALIGINRVNRKAARLHLGDTRPTTALPRPEAPPRPDLARYLDTVGPRRLVAGNALTLLDGGDAAYGAMLQAIDEARSSVALCTYIFDRDAVGLRFAEALGRAVARGVEVRVLVDGVGSLYSLPTILDALRHHKVPAARFLWTPDLRHMGFLNLRNHRKILLCDGRVGFVGSLNIRADFSQAAAGPSAAEDFTVRLEGPVLVQLQEAFALDWAFTTGERLHGERWSPQPKCAGAIPARAIPAGPDEDIGDVALTWHAALACARTRVRIVTSYFLPDDALVAALGDAARRGVDVEILLPERSNLPLVQWATTHMLPRVLDHGVRVWLSAPPFDHSKALLVDDDWVVFGSANWDPRSLRLNFELLVEVQGPDACAPFAALWERRMARARPLTPGELHGKTPVQRLRDGLSLLFKPYL